MHSDYMSAQMPFIGSSNQDLIESWNFCASRGGGEGVCAFPLRAYSREGVCVHERACWFPALQQTNSVPTLASAPKGKNKTKYRDTLFHVRQVLVL